MAKTRKIKKTLTQKRKRKEKQKGGLLGHVTGLHLSDRGIRSILTGNHRVKKRYTEKLRGECKEYYLYHPKITFKNKKVQEAYNVLRSESTTGTDFPTFMCGLNGRLLKHSSYGPDGSTFISEGFEQALKRTMNKGSGKTGWLAWLP
jgi:hypothetical protein